MIQEIKDILLNAISRAFNPIISSFVISWIFINYRITLAIFDSISHTDKIKIIETQLSNINLSVIYPLTYALIHTIAIPLIDIIYTLFISKINNVRELILLKSRNAKPYSIQESKRIFTELREQIKKQTNENSLLYTKTNQQIEDLKISRYNDLNKIQNLALIYFYSEEKYPVKNVNLFMHDSIGEEDKNEIILRIKIF